MVKKLNFFSATEKWSPKNVVNWIVACRADKGIPIFKTRYAGVKFSVRNEPAVLGVCWGGEDTAPSILFTDVPEEDLKLIEEGIGDWKRLIEKYGTEKEKREVFKYGVRLKELPK